MEDFPRKGFPQVPEQAHGRRSQSAGRHRKPGQRKKPVERRPIRAVPAVAGIATIVAAATGAIALHTNDSLAAAANQTKAKFKAEGASDVAASLNQLRASRQAAAERADRERRQTLAELEKQKADKAADIKARATWEASRTAEIAKAEKRAAGASDVPLVLDRYIRWSLPLSKFRLTGRFGDAGSLWVNDHTGLDFAAPSGSKIRSVGEGEIVDAGYAGAYGNRIKVRLLDGTELWYCHMSEYERRSGKVEAGEVIGYVGSTGNSTGPHLHLEVRPDGEDPIDPESWLRERGLDL
jgi:murein DD-endopeptidase MepM/ murein hydrolase activator NlpD